jgi:diguanylate cyclase (GGDEF)-like protein
VAQLAVGDETEIQDRILAFSEGDISLFDLDGGGRRGYLWRKQGERETPMATNRSDVVSTDVGEPRGDAASKRLRTHSGFQPRAHWRSGAIPTPPAGGETVLQGTLLSELKQIAEAPTASEASERAVSLRPRLAGPHAAAYGELIDVLIRRAQEYDRVRWLAGSDELTGIANRRSFNEALRRELSRTSRDGRPVALLLVDVDGLKAINDRLGHPEGDRALRRVARSTSESVRHGDLVARIGGDEFAVLLPNTDLPMARTVAQRIGERLAKHDPKDGLTVRVSIGAAVANSATTRLELLRAADADLYRHKPSRR